MRATFEATAAGRPCSRRASSRFRGLIPGAFAADRTVRSAAWQSHRPHDHLRVPASFPTEEAKGRGPCAIIQHSAPEFAPRLPVEAALERCWRARVIPGPLPHPRSTSSRFLSPAQRSPVPLPGDGPPPASECCQQHSRPAPPAPPPLVGQLLRPWSTLAETSRRLVLLLARPRDGARRTCFRRLARGTRVLAADRRDACVPLLRLLSCALPVER